MIKKLFSGLKSKIFFYAGERTEILSTLMKSPCQSTFDIWNNKH